MAVHGSAVQRLEKHENVHHRGAEGTEVNKDVIGHLAVSIVCYWIGQRNGMAASKG